MPQFNYIAIDRRGRRVHQLATSSSKVELANTLKRNHYFIVEISELSAKEARLPRRLRLNDKIFFTQNVATLLASGMPLGGAIDAIAEDTEDKRVIALYHAIRTDLERGFPFSKALGRYPTIFDPVYVSLVEAGENSGKLEEVMAKLADGLEKDRRTITQVRSALIYPTFILIALIVLGGLIMTFVLPKLIPVFEELEIRLPFTTRLLLGASRFIVNYPAIVVSALAALGGGLILGLRSPKGQIVLGRIANRTPLIKQIIRYLDLFRLSGTMELLLAAGVPIQKSITIAAKTIHHPQLKSEIAKTAEEIAAGGALARALDATTLPRTFIALVAVGERSGKIDFTFGTLAVHYEHLLDTALKNFTSMIEPVLTLGVGLLVGGTILSIMVPLYQVVGTISGK